MNYSRLVVPSLALLAGLSATAAAQSCNGIPGGSRGVLTYGFEGTDGSTGQGVGFARSGDKGALSAHFSSMDRFARADPRTDAGMQVSKRLFGSSSALCFSVGADWSRFRADSGFSWSSTYGGTTTYHGAAGWYNRYGIPVGLSLGHEYNLASWLSVIPSLSAQVAINREHYKDNDAAPRSLTNGETRLAAGLTVASSWLVVRSTLTAVNPMGSSLVRRQFPLFFSLHFGVRY